MRKRKKTKNKSIVILILIIIFGIIVSICYPYIKHGKTKLDEEYTIKNINNHYNKFVKTNKETNLYDKDNNIVGTVGKSVELSLDNIDINDSIKYFKVSDFNGEYYIKYQDVDKIDNLTEINDRYKNYIVFNENIVTNDKTSFYDDEDKLMYTFNKTYDLPIIIKDDNKYGVEFNNRLLYVKKEDVKEIKKSNNTEKRILLELQF